MASFKRGDRVRVVSGQYDDGCTGIVACVYPSGRVDVDMLDGPDVGWIKGFVDPKDLGVC